MASLAKVYKIKWYGPYKEKDLPKRKSNIVYLWVGKRKSNPSVKYCVPQYCGITGRGVYRFFDSKHKKDELMPKYRKCWIGKIVGGKRKTSKNLKNSALERTESLLVYFLKRQKLNNEKCCVLNERKGLNPPDISIGILSTFYKVDKSEYGRTPSTVKNLKKVILWDVSSKKLMKGMLDCCKT